MSAHPWLIVGLGNPGSQYEKTRHNVGYLVVDVLAGRVGAKLAKHRRAHADAAEGRLGEVRVVLLRSRSYMNESGPPVRAAVDYARIPIAQIIVVQDEIDLPFGTVRLKFGGGDGGHNGLKSIKNAVGSADFNRVRLGVGRPPGSSQAADHVLKPFTATERKELPLLIETAADAVEVIMSDGLQAAQNRYHTE